MANKKLSLVAQIRLNHKAKKAAWEISINEVSAKDWKSSKSAAMKQAQKIQEQLLAEATSQEIIELHKELNIQSKDQIPF